MTRALRLMSDLLLALSVDDSVNTAKNPISRVPRCRAFTSSGSAPDLVGRLE